MPVQGRIDERNRFWPLVLGTYEAWTVLFDEAVKVTLVSARTISDDSHPLARSSD